MQETPQNPKDRYELLENDAGEIMLLLYAGETAPKDATFKINEIQQRLELFRNPKDVVIIEGLTLESISKLNNIDTLYVCEMKHSDNQNTESGLVYAYPATLIKFDTPIEKTPVAVKSSQTTTEESTNTPEKNISVAEKAKLARQKVLNKEKPTQPE